MLEGKTILLVDDDERNIFALSAVLRSKRPIIITAKDGIDCLVKLKSNPTIDLVLLDMMMPEMDGYETLKEIRKNHLTKSLPVISLTAQAMKGDKQKCIDAGANDYCAKPVDINALVEQMTRLLNL